MKNWVISEDREFVSQVGELLIQCTTIEKQLLQIFKKIEEGESKQNDFSQRTFGGKISILGKVLKSKKIETRLNSIKEIRNRIAHDIVSYDPIKRKPVIEKLPNLNLNEENEKISELITDMQVLILSLDNENFKNSILKYQT